MMLFFDNIGARIGVNGAIIAIACLLVIALLLLILIVKLLSGNKSGAKDVDAPAPVKHSPGAYIPEAQAGTPIAAPAVGLSAKKVAAIMAAVSAASGVPVNQLRFTAIKRAGGFTSPWSASGTADIINTRQTYL